MVEKQREEKCKPKQRQQGTEWAGMTDWVQAASRQEREKPKNAIDRVGRNDRLGRSEERGGRPRTEWAGMTD